MTVSVFPIGSVGKPFPSVKFRIVTEDGETVLCEGDNENIIQHEGGVGALEIKGESVFKGYLNLDEVTKESFNNEGWFLTGVFQVLFYLSYFVFFLNFTMKVICYKDVLFLGGSILIKIQYEISTLRELILVETNFGDFC